MQKKIVFFSVFTVGFLGAAFLFQNPHALISPFGTHLGGIGLEEESLAQDVSLDLDQTTDQNPSSKKLDLKKKLNVIKISAFLAGKIPNLSAPEAYRLTRLILKLSYYYKFHPYFILSVIDVESSFRMDAVSPKGALGLMQLMPDTAQWVAQSLNLTVRTDELFNPELNLKLGVHYLAYLRDKFNGDMKKALQAYNRGPAKVDIEISRGGLADVGYYQKVRDQYAFIKDKVL